MESGRIRSCKGESGNSGKVESYGSIHYLSLGIVEEWKERVFKTVIQHSSIPSFQPPTIPPSSISRVLICGWIQSGIELQF